MPVFKKPEKKALTLLELTIAIIIIGILAGLALPRFSKTFEVTRGKQAIAALRQIHTAERIYRIKEGFYYPYQTDPATPESQSDTSQIYEYLNVRIERPIDRNWAVSVETTSADDFTAAARRRDRSGQPTGPRITIDKDGRIDKTGGPYQLP